MSKKIITGILLLSALINPIVYGQNQKFSKNSIKIGFGAGVSIGNNTNGAGFVYTVGYQREIRTNRLRLNPDFSIGHYSSKLMLDARDQYFNSINIETNINYDLIRIKWFSLVIGCGCLVNNSRGLRGTGGYPDGNTEPLASEYVSDFHFGGYAGGGFRINLPDKRTALNIMPFNIHYGNNYFAEFHTKIELDFKF